jgi:hypothetical protein
VKKEREIAGWWSFLIAVIFKPTWEFLTTSVLFLFLATTTWFRDNFASEEWKRRLELKGFLPHMHPAWWLCIGLLVLVLLIIRESHRLWAEQANANAELRAVEKPRPNLRVTGYNNVQRDWRIMRNSGQVDKDSKSGSAYGFQLWIENTPLEDQLGIAAEKVVAQITFNKDGKPMFVADGWWPEKIINAEEEFIRYHKQKDIGVGATEYLEIAFKFHWSSAAYGLNDGSRSSEEWCNPALKLEPGSYSASVRLVGPNVNTARTIEFTNIGSTNAFKLDSF